MKVLFHKLLDLLIPPRCPVCNTSVSETATLCPNCFSKLHFVTKPHCRLCGRPFQLALGDDTLCAQCLQHPPRFQKARAALVYDEAAKNLILPFKHYDRLDLVPLLCKMMTFPAEELMPNIDIVAPIPLHRWRLLKRKYNQSALLAQHLAKQYHKVYIPDLLKRTRATPSQGHLKAQQRRRNVARAFALPKSHLVLGKSILLVDDVLTTGATANECSKLLLAAHASSVSLLTIAVTIQSHSH